LVFYFFDHFSGKHIHLIIFMKSSRFHKDRSYIFILMSSAIFYIF